MLNTCWDLLQPTGKDNGWWQTGICKSESTDIDERFVASDAAEDSDQPAEVARSFTGD